jgi:hypothetical protein
MMATMVALNLIPFVGPVVVQAINLYEGETRNRKLDGLLDEIRRQLSRLDESKLDRAFIETPEFEEAALKAFEAGRTTGDGEKRRLIAAALVGSVTTDRPPALDVEAVLDTLRVLTPTDLRLARTLYEEAGADSAWAIVRTVVAPADFPDRDFHMKRLEAAGLIASTAGQNLSAHEEYLLTSTFRRLMALVEAAPAT